MNELEDIMGDEPKEETVTPTDPPEDPKKEPKEETLVPVAALQDERRKRQALQEELKSLKGQLPQDDPPDPYEDPEKYKAYLREQWEKERLAEEQTRLTEKIETSESEMLEKHADYTQMKNHFLVMAQQDPSLTQQMIDSSNPAKFAYDKGKEYFDEIKKSAIDEYLKKDTPDVAPSLASATAPSNSTEIVKEEELDEMFADQKY